MENAISASSTDSKDFPVSPTRDSPTLPPGSATKMDSSISKMSTEQKSGPSISEEHLQQDRFIILAVILAGVILLFGSASCYYLSPTQKVKDIEASEKEGVIVDPYMPSYSVDTTPVEVPKSPNLVVPDRQTMYVDSE